MANGIGVFVFLCLKFFVLISNTLNINKYIKKKKSQDRAVIEDSLEQRDFPNGIWVFILF